MRIFFSLSIVIILIVGGFFIFTNYMQNNSTIRTVVERGDYGISSKQTIGAGQLQVVGWIPYWDSEAAFKTVTGHVASFDYISLFWYYLSTDGEITKYGPAREDRPIITFAHANGIKALVLIANLPDTGGGDWDSGRVDRVIASEDARIKHVEAIVRLVDQHNFDGVNIDYEVLKSFQKDNFTIFIKELSDALHAKGKIVAVALHPKTSEGNPSESNGSQGQDWKELGKYADQLHLMTYEQHNSGTGPGPSATNDSNRKVIAYAKTLIPTEKIFLGIGLYAYEWDQNEDETRGLTYTKVDQIAANEDPEIERDEASGEPYFVYENEEGNELEIWFNDFDSTQGRLNFARKEGVGGVGFWRLGDEDERIWELFKD